MTFEARAALAVVLFALTAGCGPAAQETLRLGALTSMTGALAETGVAQLDAARLAAAEINAAGGVLGKKLVLVVRDDGSDPRKAERATQALLAEKTEVIIGSVSSSLTLQIAGRVLPTAVMISGSATTTVLTNFADQGRLFRTCSSDLREGRLLAQRAYASGLKRAALVHRAGENDSGLAESFKAELLALGGEVVFRRTYDKAQPSYRPLLAELVSAQPETVLLDADPVDGAQLMRDYLSGFPGGKLSWIFTHAQHSAAFVEGVGARNFGFPHFGAGAGTPIGRRYTAFAEAYERANGAPPSVGAFCANVYDAVYLAALAIEQAGSTDPERVKAALSAVSLGGRAFGPDEYGAAVEAAKGGQDLNYEGASGSVDLDLNGDTSAPYDLWQVVDGQFQITERAVNPAN